MYFDQRTLQCMYVVINGVICMTLIVFLGPRQRRSLQKLKMVFGTVLCLAVLMSILLVVLDTVSLIF